MKTCLLALAILAFGPALSPLEDNELMLKGTLKVMTELTNVLKPVKDKAGADDALPKLKGINQKLSILRKKEGELFKLSDEDCKELMSKYRATNESTLNALGAEVERIEKIDAAHNILMDELRVFTEAPNRMVIFAKVAVALGQIKKLDKAIQAHRLKTGLVPETLNALTEGKNAPLKDKDLRGPWGNVYRYDTSGPQNRGKMPDIWTVTPELLVVGNWPSRNKLQ